jgi:hypothetical protein
MSVDWLSDWVFEYFSHYNNPYVNSYDGWEIKLYALSVKNS